MLPLYSIPLFLTSIGVFSFGLLVLSRSPKKNLTRLFFLSAVSVSIWSFGYGLVYASADPANALMYARLAYLGVVFIPTFFCHFVVEFLEQKRPLFLGMCYTLSIVFLVVSQSSSFMEGTYRYFWGYYPKAGPSYMYFIMFFYGCFSLCLYYLLRVYLQLRQSGGNRLKLTQVKYVFLAFCVASASFSDYLPNYHIEVYPFAYLAASGWLMVMAYGTLRYRVMDLNLIIRKTLIYSLVTGILTAFYLSVITLFTNVFQGLTGYQTVFSSAAAAALVTLCFQPLRKRVQTFVDGKFFRQYVDREEKLYELSREVITHTTPEAMGIALMHVLNDTFHPKSGALYLRSASGVGFERVSGVNDGNLPNQIPDDHMLAVYFREHPKPFLIDLSQEEGHSYSTREKYDREDIA